MPTTNANTIIYATRVARYPVINIANSTATTTTLLATADAAGSLVLDVLWRTADATLRIWEVIICATGSQATAENARVAITIPASSGNNGTIALASLAALAPSLFSIDLAGNRCIGLESGNSIYVKNQATTGGAVFITAVIRDYTV